MSVDSKKQNTDDTKRKKEMQLADKMQEEKKE